MFFGFVDLSDNIVEAGNASTQTHLVLFGIEGHAEACTLTVDKARSPSGSELSRTKSVTTVIVKAETRRLSAFVNDPSAGSPTETLLRLLLPLDDQVRFSFRATGAEAETTAEGAIRRPH